MKGKRGFVRCGKCEKRDAPEWRTNAEGRRVFNVGTSRAMRCPDCSTVGDPYALRCRACCPTGHGTRFPEEEQTP